jgi:hypothetical protein
MFEQPCLDGHKSFYGKAAVVVDTPRGWVFLRSYETLVCGISPGKGFRRYWEGYSATTLRHVNSFRAMHGLPTLNKAAWLAIPVSPLR